MKAIVMTETGSPAVLQAVNLPEPEITSESQVKIHIRAAGINPIDTKIRNNGTFYHWSEPVVLGCDGAGVIVETGSAVSEFNVGDEVWYCHGGLGKEPGNYAEYTVIDYHWVSLKPSNISFVEAAVSPLVLITAWGALFDKGCLKPGQQVLIHGGAGGVGHVAIQLAKIKGAQVFSTVSSEQKEAFVRFLGCDEVLHYRDNDWRLELNRLSSAGVDLIIDTVGPTVFQQSISALKYAGRLVTLLNPGEFDSTEARNRNLTIAYELMLTPMLQELIEARSNQIDILKQCSVWMEDNLLKVQVSKVFDLKQAALAHELIEQGHCEGKLALKISPE